jgi:hypothetical protein
MRAARHLWLHGSFRGVSLRALSAQRVGLQLLARAVH